MREVDRWAVRGALRLLAGCQLWLQLMDGGSRSWERFIWLYF